jgi:GH24 family phage-related lysozyme (muramidase)
MITSQVGVNLIKSFEGCVLHSYRDAVGVLTIGYGHTGNVKDGQTITQTQAEELLKGDLKRFEDGVNSLVKVKLNQNQFDALVSFSYNVGVGALKTSDLLEKLNKGDYTGASSEFARWCHAGGKVLKGLVLRREAERVLFLKQIEVTKPTAIYYTVKKGDTLSGIAMKYKTSLSAIMKQNPSITNANKIYVGQRIKIRG